MSTGIPKPLGGVIALVGTAAGASVTVEGLTIAGVLTQQQAEAFSGYAIVGLGIGIFVVSVLIGAAVVKEVLGE